jgi:hypothetical protein
MTRLDKSGNEISLPTEIITRKYHKPEDQAMDQAIVPVIQGYTGTNTDRKTYTEKEMTDISQILKEDTKGSKDKSSKLT